jgi:hypothetical protein
MIFKIPFLTSKKTQPVSIPKISWLTLFGEILALHSENHTKPISTVCGHIVELFKVKAVGTYRYHWILKG